MIHRWRFGVRAFAILSAVVPLFARQSVRTSSLIDSAVLLNDLKILSADNMEGRLVNSAGGEKARTFVVERFKASGVEPFGASYLEPFTFSRRSSNSPTPGVNVIGHIDGTQSPRRYIVVSAHYDHLGVRNGMIFNGADDNASGTAALFAIARYFGTHKPENSLIFAAFDAEESGDRGSAAWLTSTPVDIASIIADVNMDMIGRDPDPKLFAVGTKANPVLRPVLEEVMSKARVKLFGHETSGGQPDTPEEDWSKSSDHYSFQSAKIPAIYLGDEDFAQHHKATDKFATMSFDFYIGAVETSLLTVQSFDKHLDEIAKVRAGN